MGELWRSVSETMWKRPLVWLPVLIADLIGFFINFGRLALLRSMLKQRVEYHSALGGAPVHGQLTAATVRSLSTMALVVDWTSYWLRLLLYAAALIATAALVRAFTERNKRPLGEVRPAMRENATGILSLSLRALAINGAGAVIFAWIANVLVSHGHKVNLASQWLEITASVVIMLALALLLAPVGVQIVARRHAPAVLRQRAQIFAVSLGAVALLLGTYVAANMRTIRGDQSVGRVLLELTGSWIVAVPYAILFTGISFLAVEVPAEAEAETPAAAG